MIKINDEIIKVEYFPDSTQRLSLLPNVHKLSDIKFEWKYESDEELTTLIFLVKHLRNTGFVGHFILYMSFVPNSRMDRTYNDSEVFTLKYFCDIINDLHFAKVLILDPHSNVTPALLNNVIVDNGESIIKSLINDKIKENNLILYYPDFGAYKKYSNIFPLPYCYGKKKRDWDTGKILGIDIENELDIDLKDKTILMIDDICSYGGTFKYGADKLKELGVGKIYAYATHTENSVLDTEKGTLIKSLENNTVERLFTTNSLFSCSHEKITVMEV